MAIYVKHLELDSSTDLHDWYSNLFLNAYINRHAHTEYLKMIEVYSPLGIWHVFLYSINTNNYHFRTGNMRKYHQIDVYIYQCVIRPVERTSAKLIADMHSFSNLASFCRWVS